MDVILNWVKQIIIFYIMANVVIHVLPKGKYDKYVKFFIGIVLIIIVIKPLTGFFDLDKAFNWFYQNSQFSLESSEVKTQLKAVSKEQYTSVLQPYREKIEEKITEIVEENGLYMGECEVNFNMDENSETFGQLVTIDTTVSTKYKSSDKIQIDKIKVKSQNESNVKSSMDVSIVNVKKSIADFYNLDLSNINVSEE